MSQKPSIGSTDSATPSTGLASWYATVLFWKPQVALLVNERTLLPVLMPLAPAKTFASRFPAHLGEALAAHGWSPDQINREVRQFDQHQLFRTSNRSVLGSLNEFAFLAEVHRQHDSGDDLRSIALALANTPCKPISYQSPSDLVAAIGTSGTAPH